MSRSHRLNELMQVLRRHRGSVSGAMLAQETNVSLRTIRRDIATLQAMGAKIDGAAGVGYMLKPGFLLPPMTFNEDELQALVAGAQWVSQQTDQALALGAQNALAKIGAVIPADMKLFMEDDMLYVGERPFVVDFDSGVVRYAMREQKKLKVAYINKTGDTLAYVIWPLILGFVDSRWSIAAWCEIRHLESFWWIVLWRSVALKITILAIGATCQKNGVIASAKVPTKISILNNTCLA
ncbi:YafY family protein [Methylophilus sp. 13]|uniref:helix-turn-helix transcriptional regulator n=1 Tax=Methylophilus sp. 13 TaxID=2781018 RepID=UPI001E51B42E|nr:YafY family protein [Methylophilus sp. 13]